MEKETSKDWNAAHALLMWVLGFLILVSFGYLQIVNIWISRILIELLIAVIPILTAYSIFKSSFEDIGLKKLTLKDVFLAIAFGVLGVAVGAASFQIEVLILGGVPESFIEFQLQFVPQTGIDLLIWVSFSMIIVGPCEEIFSRGFIQKGLEKSTTPLIGLILASMLFGALHLDVYRIFPTAMEGLVLGAAYLYTGRKTSTSAISHGVLNSIIFILMFFFPNYYGL